MEQWCNKVLVFEKRLSTKLLNKLTISLFSPHKISQLLRNMNFRQRCKIIKLYIKKLQILIFKVLKLPAIGRIFQKDFLIGEIQFNIHEQ